MTVRRRIAPIILLTIISLGLGFGYEASLNNTPDIAVVDTQLPTLGIQQ